MNQRAMAITYAELAPSGSAEQKLFRKAEDHYEKAENRSGPYLFQERKSEYAKGNRAFKKALELRKERQNIETVAGPDERIFN